MNRYCMKNWMLALLSMIALQAMADTARDSIPPKNNKLSIDLQFMGRGEMRYGGITVDEDVEETEEGSSEVPKSNFLLSRTRLAINYQRDWLEACVTPQHSGVWGQAGKGAFNLYETWVKLTSRQGLFAQVGRVALSYDDGRIIGSDDWAMASQSHDVLRVGYEGHGHKAHAIFAYNQNSSAMTGSSYYVNGAQPYKTMQTVWYHYDLPKFPLGASLLFMNIGMQGEDESPEAIGKKDKGVTRFQHLLGGFVSFNPDCWQASAAYYHQFGHNEEDMKIDAWMASAKVTFKPKFNYSFTVGYDYLSGDKYFAVPSKGSLGMVHHDVLRGFSTVYGAHHQFYGAMDFFYVSTYLNGFTPGLQNVYVGGQYSPLRGLTINGSYHYLAIATNLPNMKRTLGHEIELQASYSLSRDVCLSVGGSWMKGSETMKKLKRSSHNNILRWSWISLNVTPRIFSTKW